MNWTSHDAGQSNQKTAVESIDGLEAVPDEELEWCDARTVTAIYPEAVPIDGAGQVPADVPVEIKSCQLWYRNQRGRIYFRQKQHQRLVDANAWYLFEVYLPTEGFPVVAKIFVPAEKVDELLGAWTPRPDRHGETGYQQRSWRLFIDPEDVDERCPNCDERLFDPTNPVPIGSEDSHTCNVSCAMGALIADEAVDRPTDSDSESAVEVFDGP